MKWFVAILLTALLAVPAAQAQGDSVDVNIGRFVEFVDEGTVEERLTVTCTGTVLEAFAYVVQRVAHT